MGLSESFHSHGYQAWVMQAVLPLLGKSVLELGAGAGAVSRWMQGRERVALVEPEACLREFLVTAAPRWFKGARSTVWAELADALADPETARSLDTVVSFNVLEHVEDDEAMLRTLADALRKSSAPGPKRLISFVPAQSWAYGTLDSGVGHFRRYDRAPLEALCRRVAPEAKVSLRPFNAVSLPVWWFNGKVLKGPGGENRAAVRSFERLLPLLKPIDFFLLKVLRLPVALSLIAVIEWP